MARLQGFEPGTYGLEGRCSILLSYRRIPYILPPTEYYYSKHDLLCQHVMEIIL